MTNGAVLVVGGNFSNIAVGYNAPISRGLTSLFLTNTSLQKAVINLVPAGANATVVGTPVASAGYITCEATTGYLLAPVKDTTECTIFVAVNVPTAPTTGDQEAAIFGNAQNANIGGISLSWLGITDVLATGYFTPSAGGTAVFKDTVIATAAFGTWQFFAVVVDSTNAALTIYNLTQGTTATVATGGPLLPNNIPENLSIGSSPVAVSDGDTTPVQIALFETHNVALLYSEIAQAYAVYKTVLAANGITV